MGSVWFLFLVILSVQQALSMKRDCSEEALESIRNCDECIRCGATWCKDRNTKIRCTSTPNDGWCPERFQGPRLDSSQQSAIPGSTMEPAHHQRFVQVQGEDEAIFKMYEKHNKVSLEFVNSTVLSIDEKNPPFAISSKITFEQDEYIVKVTGSPQNNFCPVNGRVSETITFKVQVPSKNDQATITYQVPCACDCNSVMPEDVNSEKCNKRGDYTSCGSCACQRGWKGEKCEEKETHCERGDIGSCRNIVTGDLCSGNGICTCKDSCDCFTDRPGSQYYDHQCTDICMSTGFCDSCLLNAPIGKCPDCNSLYFNPLNRTLLDDKDEEGRKVWVECEEKANTCAIKYVAMKENGITYVMIIEPCNAIVLAQSGGGVNVTVPVILGVLALVAAAAAVAGYMVWKNRAPPLPLTDPQYTNIDAEDCTGENPLYKPPTSKFTNPTYGRW